MSFEVHLFPNGQASVLSHFIGESMHSKIGPWNEANEVYVAGSKLQERLFTNLHLPLIVYDVGLGIAANVLALIDAYLRIFKENPKIRDLYLVSFEITPEGLEFALGQLGHFPFLSQYEHQIKTLLKIRSIQVHPKIRWELKVGDFREIVPALSYGAELVFFDLYSPEKSQELWGVETFKLFHRPSQETTLITYSAATRIRTALLLAGFHVGKGQSTLAKRETTKASTSPKWINAPLNQDWLKHWERSTKRLPFGTSDSEGGTIFGELSKILQS